MRIVFSKITFLAIALLSAWELIHVLKEKKEKKVADILRDKTFLKLFAILILATIGQFID